MSFLLTLGQWSSGYEARKSAHKSDGIIDELFLLFLFFLFFTFSSKKKCVNAFPLVS